MDNMSLSGTLICGTLLAVVLYPFFSRAKLQLPPGPRKLPVIGNLFDIRGRRIWEACMEWSRKYDSDIIHLNLAGTSFIVLSSIKATEDLLERRSSIYSDRPAFPMFELMEWDFSLALLKYGDTWRTQRRLFNQHLNVTASQQFQPRERAAAHSLIRRLLDTPEAFLTHNRLLAGEIILPITYGVDVQPVNDPNVDLAEKMVQAVKQAVSGRFLLDFLPFLKYVPEWVPGAGFQKIAREGRVLVHALTNVPFAEVERQIADGQARPSFTANSLRDIEVGPRYYDARTVKEVAAMMYAAGADTTVSALSTFFLAVLANPDAQKKAQMEIDSVVGHGNLPDFCDQEAMPYVTALVKEVLRWNPVAPFGLPHFLQVEDEYRGFKLPANSLVVGNVWAILHDEKIYPDPYLFNPERFMLNGKLNPAVPDPQAVFGFGRRICPGKHLAASSLWIAIASVLAVFDITKKIGQDGQVIEPSYEYDSDIISSPLPFECSIQPRSLTAEQLIRDTRGSRDHLPPPSWRGKRENGLPPSQSATQVAVRSCSSSKRDLL